MHTFDYKRNAERDGEHDQKVLMEACIHLILNWNGEGREHMRKVLMEACVHSIVDGTIKDMATQLYQQPTDSLMSPCSQSLELGLEMRVVSWFQLGFSEPREPCLGRAAWDHDFFMTYVYIKSLLLHNQKTCSF